MADISVFSRVMAVRRSYNPTNLIVNLAALESSLMKEILIKPEVRPCHCSSDYSPTSHSGGPGSSLGQVMWDLW
jgi:hypothetical protein